MSIYDKIMADIKTAMIDKNNVKRDCLRSIISEIKNKTINAGKEITDAICLSVIKSSAKQHEDSIENFKVGHREDLAMKESEELTYISEYLPKMMSEADLQSTLNKILETVEPIKKNIGIIMKSLPNNADRGMASKILSGILK